MKKILLLVSLLLSLTSCEQKDEEEDISDLRRMVQAPGASSSRPNTKESPSESVKR